MGFECLVSSLLRPRYSAFFLSAPPQPSTFKTPRSTRRPQISCSTVKIAFMPTIRLARAISNVGSSTCNRAPGTRRQQARGAQPYIPAEVMR